MESLIETFIVDTVSRMDDENRKAFMESDCFKQLCEAGILEAKSIVRLNQADDFDRRVKVAAIAKAHANNDALEAALRKNRRQEKALLDKIYKKYSTQVKRDVMVAQRKMKQINPQVFNTLRAIR
jgi:purine nucleoside permease